MNDLIRDLSSQLEGWGLPPAAASILACLALHSKRSLTVTELHETLGISRGAISTHARSLTQLGMIQKVRVIGSRAAAYEIKLGFLEEHLEQRRRRIRAVREIAIRAAQRDPSNERAERLVAFYRHWERGMRTLHDEWLERDAS